MRAFSEENHLGGANSDRGADRGTHIFRVLKWNKYGTALGQAIPRFPFGHSWNANQQKR